MFREMRLKREKMTEEDCIAILEKGTSGVLAVLEPDGYPYAVPLSYAYCDGKIYFHGTQTGLKMDALRHCDKVSFCVIAKDQVVPEEYTTYFKSVIAFGRARILTDTEEKKQALIHLGEKYSSAYREGYTEEIEEKLSVVGAIEITVEHMTGKMARELL